MQTSIVQSLVRVSGVEDGKVLPSIPSTGNRFGDLFSQLMLDESNIDSDPDLDEADPADTEIPDELPLGPEVKVQQPQVAKTTANSIQPKGPEITALTEQTLGTPTQSAQPDLGWQIGPDTPESQTSSDDVEQKTDKTQGQQPTNTRIKVQNLPQIPAKQHEKLSINSGFQIPQVPPSNDDILQYARSQNSIDGSNTQQAPPPTVSVPRTQTLAKGSAAASVTQFTTETSKIDESGEFIDTFTPTVEDAEAEFGRTGINFSLSTPAATALETSRAGTVRFAGTQMVDALIRQPNQPVEIALNPEELGRVRIVLTHLDTGLTVAISAERPETLDLMRRHIEQLAAEFRQLGYENIGFEFSGGDANSSDQSETESQPSSDHMTDTPDSKTLSPVSTPTTGVDIRL